MFVYRSKDEDEDEGGSFAQDLANMEPWDSEMFGDDAPDVGQGPDTERTSVRWSRPDPPDFDPNKDDLIFQQIDIDHYTGTLYYSCE